MEINQYLQFGIALILVLGLMGLFGFVLKKLNEMQSGALGKSNRLKIVEQRMIDPKSKILLVQCDQKEYLVMTSPAGNTILEGGMKVLKKQSKEGAT